MRLRVAAPLMEVWEKALRELDGFPKGKPGEPQGLFRALLYGRMAQFHSTTVPRRPDQTRESVIAEVVEYVRERIDDPTWLPVRSEPMKSNRSDFEFKLEWIRLSEGGAWMASVYNVTGDCLDTSVADDPEDALLAVAERLLPQG